MAPEIELESVQRAVAESGARWLAGPTSMLELEPEAQRVRLGLSIDEADLRALRQRPAPDVDRLAATAILRPEAAGRSEALEIATRVITSTRELRDLTARLVVERVIPVPLWWFHVDWRNRFGINAVTPIRDQGGCGSCVAFGTIATLESMLVRERNVTLDLSEAELLFCGGGSCGGWWPTNAVTYLSSSGVAQESCFPYQPMNMPCNPCQRRNEEAIKVTASTIIFDVGQRKDYLAWVGPMTGAFTVYFDFFSYTGGVYTHVTGPVAGGHCIEVIGYDDFEGCWICKNSWGAGWGEGGLFRIAYGQCDIDSGFPFWGISGTEFWE